MKNPHLDEKDERLMMIAVAQLRSENRMQTEIARTLGISQPQVSRFLKQALKKKILGVAPPPPLLEKNITLEEKQQAQAKYFASAELRNKLYPHVSRNIFFDVREFTGDEDQFARSAAARVLQLFQQSRYIGAMSGKHMHNVVENIKFLTTSAKTRFPYTAECFPLCGDAVHLMNLRQMDYSGSHLAALINECLTDKDVRKLPCLTGVPAYVSLEFQKDKGFKKFLDSITGFRDIFGGEGKDKERPKVDMADTILTGIGIISALKTRDGENLTSAFIRERIAQEPELTEENLNKIVLGDIGGILIERNRIHRKRVDELNEGWIGMREQHFHQVAAGARESGPPGVIAVVFGEEKKADLAFEIIKRGMVNHLLVHSDLVKRLKILAEQNKNQPTSTP